MENIEAFDILGNFIFLIIICVVIYWIIQVPIMIAKNRGISEGELQTITILSWCGILIGITWFVALILSLVWTPKNWIEKKSQEEKLLPSNSLESLEKLAALKEKGIITEEEFAREKAKILFYR